MNENEKNEIFKKIFSKMKRVKDSGNYRMLIRNLRKQKEAQE